MKKRFFFWIQINKRRYSNTHLGCSSQALQNVSLFWVLALLTNKTFAFQSPKVIFLGLWKSSHLIVAAYEACAEAAELAKPLGAITVQTRLHPHC